MNAVFTLLILSLSVFLAGCVDTQSESENEEPNGLEPSYIPATHSASGCIESSVVVAVEYDHVQSLLPEGFTALQIGVHGGAGLAFVGVLVVECQTQSWGNQPLKFSDVVVWIEDPQIPGAPNNIVGHRYMLETQTNEPTFEAHLRSIGWRVQNATMAVSVSSTGPLFMSEAIVSSDNPNQRVEVSTTTAVPPSSYSEENFLIWHQTDFGISYNHLVASATGSSGVGFCAFGPDTMAANATGINECIYAEGYHAENLEWEGSITVLQE